MDPGTARAYLRGVPSSALPGDGVDADARGGSAGGTHLHDRSADSRRVGWIRQALTLASGAPEWRLVGSAGLDCRPIPSLACRKPPAPPAPTSHPRHTEAAPTKRSDSMNAIKPTAARNPHLLRPLVLQLRLTAEAAYPSRAGTTQGAGVVCPARAGPAIADPWTVNKPRPSTRPNGGQLLCRSTSRPATWLLPRSAVRIQPPATAARAAAKEPSRAPPSDPSRSVGARWSSAHKMAVSARSDDSPGTAFR